MKQLFIFLCGFLLLCSSVVAQKIDFSVRYNSSSGEYEVYGRPNFSAATFNVGGGSQLTVVLPQSVANNALTITSVNGGVWVDNSRVYAPAAAPTLDFHGVSTTGAPMAWTSGTETLLFKFTLGGNCVAGVRLFENATDPQSNAAGMLGGDFNNYFANALTFADVYQSNYNNTGTSCSVAPVANPDVASTSSTTPVNIPVLNNDTSNGTPATTNNVTVSITTPPPVSQGTATVNPDGTITFTPASGYTGTSTFTYTICDKTNSTLCSTATVTVNVSCSSVAPTLSATAKANVCPATTVDLSTITASNVPSGFTLGWFSSAMASAATLLSNVNALPAGTYYVAFYNTTTGCYGSTTPVTATVNVCCPVAEIIPSLIKN